ncbi:MAG: PTS lactose/cellobiose transporter subunit IIA [Clostridium butyricum]|nr:PTS lactose/cellobiose transporter subunit IIA [Clostridium butyricum]
MECLEMTCLQIITNVGLARSSYIEAISKAREKDFQGANECIMLGKEKFLKGHELHLELFRKEDEKLSVSTTVLLMHAEDQLMSAEGFRIIAEELLENYKIINNLEQKIEGVS